MGFAHAKAFGVSALVPVGLAIGVAMPTAILTGCPADPIIGEGQLGRPFSLATGDDSPLPRVVFIDEGCPGADAVGGCAPSGDRSCEPLLIDSLAPLTALPRPDSGGRVVFRRECIDVRSGDGIAGDSPTPAELDGAVTRFRFRDLPTLRAPAAGTQEWSWTAGSATGAGSAEIVPGGVIGGNALRQFAVGFRYGPAARRITFYSEFPGTDRDLADQGLGYIPLQFPGRLLGKDIGDVCSIEGENCLVGGFDLQGRPNVALEATRMVIDACVATPPCTVVYFTDPFDPFTAGVCSTAVGPDTAEACIPANDPDGGGRPASLVVATGVPGLVLFDDSAVRMFGDLDALPACDAVTTLDPACFVAQDGTLHMAGWPSAGDSDAGDLPLHRLRIRSVALLPGLRRARGPEPCTRAFERFDGLLSQCNSYIQDFERTGNIEDTTPPYAAAPEEDGDIPSANALAVIGEAHLGPDREEPDAGRWIEALVLPATHAVPLSVRRDVAPEALEPDGLLGTALFDDRSVVLDYTDPNPGVRLSCLDPSSGDCLVAPECSEDAQTACCFGLPVNLLAEFIFLGDDDSCCSALSGSELAEIQDLGVCRGISPR